MYEGGAEGDDGAKGGGQGAVEEMHSGRLAVAGPVCRDDVAAVRMVEKGVAVACLAAPEARVARRYAGVVLATRGGTPTFRPFPYELA